MALLSIGLGVITAPFTAGLGLAGTAVKGFMGALSGAFSLLKSFWMRIKKWALIATAALAGTIYMAAKFQKQMAFVSTMVKDTGQWMGKFTEGVKQMSVSFGQSTSNMAQALYDILSASVPPKKALEMLKTAAEAAVAGFTDVEQVGKTLTSVMNGMGISFEQSGKVADVMFRIVEKGQLTFNQLQGNMARAMVAARAARVPFEELGAAYSFLTRKGFSVAMAETAIARALTSTLTPRKEARQAAERFGIELGESALATKGLLGVIKDLAKAGLTEAQLQELFPAIRARNAISAMIKDVKGFEGDVTAMYQAGGAQGRAFAKATETLAFQFSKFIQAMKVFLIDLVTPMLPALQKLFNRLSMIAEYLRKTFAVDIATDMAAFADNLVKKIENAIFWIMLEVPNMFRKIWGYLQFTIKIIETVLDVGILKTLLGAYWTYLTNFLENIFRVVTGLARAVGERLYQIARKAWWEIKSFITGEAIPDYVNEFIGMLDYIELQLTNRMPDAFKEGWNKASKWLDEYNKKSERKYAESKKNFADLQDKMNQEELKKVKDNAESASKIDHSFENEKMNMAKIAIKEIIEEETKKIEHLKALGQLSLDEELKRYKKLLSIAKADTEERMALERKVYELEKSLREKRKSDAFEAFGYMEKTEREVAQAKIVYLEKFLKEEKGSYDERRAAAIELFKLRQELRKMDVEEQKKLNEFYMDEDWKRLKAQEEILKKRQFMFARDKFTLQKINEALEKNLRRQAEQRAEFVRKLTAKQTETWDLEGLRRLKIAERHAEEAVKKDKLSAKEKASYEKKLEEIREQIAQARGDVMKKEGIKTKDLLKKEEEWNKALEKEIAKATGKKVDEVAEKEKSAQEKRVQEAEQTKQKVGEIGDEAKGKIKEVSEAMQDSMTNAIQAILEALKKLEQQLIIIFERIRQICAAAQCGGVLPVPAVAKGAAGRLLNGGKAGAGASVNKRDVKVGPIYIGKIDSMVDAIRAGEKIGEELASSAGRDFRAVL